MSTLTAPLLGARFESNSSRVMLENHLLLSTSTDAAMNFVFEGMLRIAPDGAVSNFMQVANSTAKFMSAYPDAPERISGSHRHPVPSMFSFAVAPVRVHAAQPFWPETLSMSMFSAPSSSDDMVHPAKLALHGLFRETMKRVPLTQNWLTVLRPYADAYGGNVGWEFTASRAELRFSGTSLQAWMLRVQDALSFHKSMLVGFRDPMPFCFECAFLSAGRSFQSNGGDIVCTVSEEVGAVAHSAAVLIMNAAAPVCRCVSFDVVMRPVIPVVAVDAWGGYSAANEELERCQFGCPPRDLITVPPLRVTHADDGVPTWSFDQPWAVKSMFNVTWTAVETSPFRTSRAGWKDLL